MRLNLCLLCGERITLTELEYFEHRDGRNVYRMLSFQKVHKMPCFIVKSLLSEDGKNSERNYC